MERSTSDTSPHSEVRRAGSHTMTIREAVDAGGVVVRQYLKHAGNAVLLTCIVSGCLCAQTPVQQELPPARKAPSYQKQTLNATFGFGASRSKDGLTAFWDNGLSASLSFYVNVTRSFAVGLGADVTELEFKEEEFRTAYPGVDVESNNVVLSNVYVGAKAFLLPSMRTCPYVSVSLGAQRMTEALYRKSISGVRVTYYNVGGTTRLTGAVAVGADIHINQWFAFELEGKGTYIHNDPDAGIVVAGRGGFRFTL